MARGTAFRDQPRLFRSFLDRHELLVVDSSGGMTVITVPMPLGRRDYRLRAEQMGRWQGPRAKPGGQARPAPLDWITAAVP